MLSFLKVYNSCLTSHSVISSDFLGICSYYFDHYIISSFFLSNCSSYYYPWIFLLSNILSSFYYSSTQSFSLLCIGSFSVVYYLYSFFLISSFTLTFNLFAFSLYSWQSCFPFYLFDINRFLIIPLWTSFKIIVFSFDVIHSLGFYCFGIKIDAIPWRINLASTLRSLFKGEHRGFCFELCGQGHSSMLIVGLILFMNKINFNQWIENYLIIVVLLLWIELNGFYSFGY